MPRHDTVAGNRRGPGAGNRIATAPATVLVIDDNPSTRDTFQYMLIAEGYAARTAPTVEAGLASASREAPSAILLDLHMPVTGGLECLRVLRATTPLASIPVALLTGDYFIDDAIANELSAMGVPVYFKPLWDEDLRRIVEQLLHT